MTYYDWEKIVKGKDDSELKQILRDNILGEEAYKYAKKELDYRNANKDELVQISEVINQTQRLQKISKFIAGYQLIGGILGIIALIAILFKKPEIDLYVITVLSFEFIIPGLSIVAGISLWRNKKYGLLLSKINQYLQLIHIKISILTYSYSSGVALLFGFSLKPDINIVFKSFGPNTSLEIDWLGQLGNSESFLYLNIVAIVVLYYLSKIKKVSNGK